ncbi:hypothetical protein U7859_30330 [Bradyrhizobium ottawaense]|uniref:hypothetical protein n=1 Tax=Bradyrhizobium ottawaense TaxID=931866 RepID=UPI002ADFDC3D|nr:hypothetical protein [Bradyrhizobium ottawaense]WQN81256.1 hypothetical protein U7859_30330 [Bradyrhizobium ottawaense]
MNTKEVATGNTSTRASLGVLIGFHIVACCVSLAYLSRDYGSYHIYYDPGLLNVAIAAIASFAVLSYLFLLAPFSFGYFLGFYFYTLVLGYIWLNCFSRFEYNHWLSGVSAVASMIAFMVPSLFVLSPIQRRFTIGDATFRRMLTMILALGAITILIGARYSFKIVPLDEMYNFRDKINMPSPLIYCIGVASNALLPFAFACFAERRSYWRAGLTLALLLLFYPITLNKIAFFTPTWLLAMAVLTRLLDCRITVVVSLFVPLLVGVMLYAFLGMRDTRYIEIVNLRMIATPSNAMDIYNVFFFNHPLTSFCQITLVKSLVSCPYPAQLGEVMREAYSLGNFNASLFATEGIASVGPLLAPIPVFACGLVIALANRLSSGLPPRVIFISGSIFPQILLNVPLTTTLLSHGAAVLFLLWYLTPRSFFASHSESSAAVAVDRGLEERPA